MILNDKKEDEMSKWFYKKWKIMFLSFALLLCFAISAEADIVYGRVYDDSGALLRDIQIKIIGKDQNGNVFTVAVTTNRDGSYKVFIPPGAHKVEFTRGIDKLEAWILSYPEPFHQDIYLKKS